MTVTDNPGAGDLNAALADLISRGYSVTFERAAGVGVFADLCGPSGTLVTTCIGSTPVGVHRSAHDPIRVTAAATMAAYASQVDHGLPEPRVMLSATAYRPLWLDDPDDARALADLLDLLSLATPDQPHGTTDPGRAPVPGILVTLPLAALILEQAAQVRRTSPIAVLPAGTVWLTGPAWSATYHEFLFLSQVPFARTGQSTRCGTCSRIPGCAAGSSRAALAGHRL